MISRTSLKTKLKYFRKLLVRNTGGWKEGKRHYFIIFFLFLWFSFGLKYSRSAPGLWAPCQLSWNVTKPNLVQSVHAVLPGSYIHTPLFICLRVTPPTTLQRAANTNRCWTGGRRQHPRVFTENTFPTDLFQFCCSMSANCNLGSLRYRM